MFNYIRFDKVFGADKETTNNKPFIPNFPIYRNTFFWFDTSYPQFLIVIHRFDMPGLKVFPLFGYQDMRFERFGKGGFEVWDYEPPKISRSLSHNILIKPPNQTSEYTQ